MNITPISIFRSILVGCLMVSSLSVGVFADDPPASKPSVVEGPSKEEYRSRRKTLMEKLKQAETEARALRRASNRGGGGPPLPPGASRVLVVLVGAAEAGEDSKFHQDNDFAYLSGVHEPNASMILWPETGDEALYLPPTDKSQDRWIGPRLAPGPDAANRTGFTRVESSESFLGDLFRAIGDPWHGGRSRAAVVYMLEPGSATGSTTPAARLSRFVREGAPAERFKNAAIVLHEMRKTKSDAEANLIRRAVAVTNDAQREVMRLIRPGIPEYRLEGAILGAFVAGGASRAGFPSIVGSGPNSTVLHYGKNDRTIEDGDLVVVDIGGEVKGYTADITRTYPANGRFTPRQREIYQLVLDAQTAAANDFKPGVSTIASLNRTARDFFRKSPLRASDADGNEQSMDAFFAHGLSHHMGLDVHDVGDNSKPLGPGEVFTIEPGLYLPGESLGVRIEDDYRATKDGLEKISRDIPVEADEIERLIAQGRTRTDAPAAASAAP